MVFSDAEEKIRQVRFAKLVSYWTDGPKTTYIAIKFESGEKRNEE